MRARAVPMDRQTPALTRTQEAVLTRTQEAVQTTSSLGDASRRHLRSTLPAACQASHGSTVLLLAKPPRSTRPELVFQTRCCLAWRLVFPSARS